MNREQILQALDYEIEQLTSARTLLAETFGLSQSSNPSATSESTSRNLNNVVAPLEGGKHRGRPKGSVNASSKTKTKAAGAKNGRRTPMSEEAKERIRQGQAKRWNKNEAQGALGTNTDPERVPGSMIVSNPEGSETPQSQTAKIDQIVQDSLQANQEAHAS